MLHHRVRDLCIIASFFVTHVTSLLCNEGFNATIGGIPIYFWSSSRCNNATNCMIQEASIKSTSIAFAHAQFRYGGCFPPHVERRLSCDSENVSPINSEEVKQIGAILDEKLLTLIFQFHLNPEKHLARFLSKGNGIAEFYEGVLNFFESLGYNKDEIRNPVHDLLHMNQDTCENYATIQRTMLQAMKEDNYQTERLSFSLESYLLRFHDSSSLPDSVSDIVEMLPGLSYPVLQSMGYDIDSLYDDVSTVLDSSPDDILLESPCSSSAILLFLLQGLFIELERTDDKQANFVVHIAAKNMSERCLETYPNNEQFMRINFAVNGFYDAVQQSNKCRLGRTACRKRLRKALQRIPQQLVHLNPAPSSETIDDAFRDFYVDYVEVMNEIRERPTAFLGSFISHIIDKTDKKLLRILHMTKDMNADERNFITSCKEFRCTQDMCNTHEAFTRSKETAPVQMKHQQKTEL